MKKRKLPIIAFAMFLFSTVLHGQRIFDLMQKEGVHLSEVQKEAAIYFQKAGTGEGTGYQIFKRWEHQALMTLRSDGTVLTHEDYATALQGTQSNSALGAKGKSPSDWKELGPRVAAPGFNSAGIGRVTAIYVEPIEKEILYIGAPGGGLWKSMDGGDTWTPLGDQFADMFIWSVQADSNNSDHVYIGNSLGQLQKSTDGGFSFTTIFDQTGILKGILLNPDNTDEIFVAVINDGLYHTTDGGGTWTKVIDDDIEDVVFKPGSTTTVYACGDNFYRSTNGGDSFSKVTNGIQNSNRMKLAVSPANDDYVYIVQRGTSGFGYLYRSKDSGASFTVRSDYTDGDYVGGQSGRDMAIAVSDTNINEVHIGGFVLFKSLDGGRSFKQETLPYYFELLPYLHDDIEVLQYIDGVIYVGSDGGIHKSADAGASFTDLSAGLGIQQFYRLANATSNKNTIIGGAQDNGSSIRASLSGEWMKFLGGDGMNCMIDPNDENILYASSQNGGLSISTDGGLDARYLSPPEDREGLWITPFVMDPNNSSRIYAGYSNLYRHDNGGLAANGEVSESEDWINSSSDYAFDSKLAHIAISPANSNVLYAATYYKLYKSSNVLSESPQWAELDFPVASYGGTITDIAVDPYDENRIAVSTSLNYLKLSTDGGASWNTIYQAAPLNTVKSVVFDRSPDQGIYMALDGAVYYKSNSVADWTLFSDHLPKVRLSELELYYDQKDPEDSRIRVATFGRGIWESPLYDTKKIEGNSCIDGYINPYTSIQAENFCEQSGAIQKEYQDTAIGYIKDGSFVKFNAVSFGSSGAKSFTAIVASYFTGGTIEIRLDDPKGKLVGSCEVENTNGWSSWERVTCEVNHASGDHDLYLVFTGTSEYLFNIDSFAFTELDLCNETASVYNNFEAEDFCEQSGVIIEPDGQAIGYIHNGDYIKYDNIAFGDNPEDFHFEANVSSGTPGGTIEIRLDSPTGMQIGTCEVANTGGWKKWVDVNSSVIGTSGNHDLYLVFTGDEGYLFNINWIAFNKGNTASLSTNPITDVSEQVLLYPNPANTAVNLQLPQDGHQTEIVIANLMGQIVYWDIYSTRLESNLLSVDIQNFAAGLYTVIITKGKTRLIKNLIVKK